ncbi:MAG: TIGR01777 family oxidoreductase [Polyangiaceae bacterium]
MKKILITGGTGFIGRRLVDQLLERGDQVTVLTRNPKHAQGKLPGSVRVAAWDPSRDGAWCDEVGVVDAVVHLAGEAVLKRWTDEHKKRVVDSRVGATDRLVDAIGRAQVKPSVLVTASAIGYYGPHAPEDRLDESSPAGTDFLADVCKKWEEAARGAEKHGVRSVQVRIGVVLGEDGGALEPMVKASRRFAGGPLGDGKQVVSWVHRDDVVGILMFALDHEEVTGPINAVSPYPVSNAELSRTLGTVVNRPSWFRVPAGALRLLYGDGAEVLVTGQRVFPKRAAELGYEFRQARLMRALESILGG